MRAVVGTKYCPVAPASGVASVSNVKKDVFMDLIAFYQEVMRTGACLEAILVFKRFLAFQDNLDHPDNFLLASTLHPLYVCRFFAHCPCTVCECILLSNTAALVLFPCRCPSRAGTAETSINIFPGYCCLSMNVSSQPLQVSECIVLSHTTAASR